MFKCLIIKVKQTKSNAAPKVDKNTRALGLQDKSLILFSGSDLA